MVIVYQKSAKIHTNNADKIANNCYREQLHTCAVGRLPYILNILKLGQADVFVEEGAEPSYNE